MRIMRRHYLGYEFSLHLLLNAGSFKFATRPELCFHFLVRNIHLS